MNYLHWNENTITDFSPHFISEMYEKGYVFTRIGKGVMHQTRSVRIDLARFELTSENRRILKKTDGIGLALMDLPLGTYDIAIGKMAKDFYEEKFGLGIMSAQKVKEMVTDKDKSNFNSLLSFRLTADSANASLAPIGFAICYANPSMLHYSYPFYDLANAPKDMGLGMMTRAIQYAKEKGLKYVYLGSLQRSRDVYKLQFDGLEWFDGGPEGGGKWLDDLVVAKKLLI